MPSWSTTDWRVFVRRVACALACASATFAQAGTLSRAELKQRFPSPLIVGERDAQLPVWPLFRQDGTATPLVGYVFESVDLAPIPGFSGTPKGFERNQVLPSSAERSTYGVQQR